MDSASSIDPDQPKHAVQAYPERHFSPPVDILFQESLLNTSNSLRRNVSARISLRRLICVDTLRTDNTIGFLVERLKYLQSEFDLQIQDIPHARLCAWYTRN